MTEQAMKQVSRKDRDLNSLNSNFYDNFTDRVMSAGPLGNILPVVTDAMTNVLRTPMSTLYSTNIAAQALFAPTNATLGTGLDIAGDATASDGFELNLQEPTWTTGRFRFTIGSEPVGFFIEAKFTVADVSGAAELLIGFHEVSAVKPARATYTDYALIGLV